MHGAVLLENLTGFSASQEIPRILWNQNVRCRIHKRPPLVPILSQINPVPSLMSLFHCLGCTKGSVQPRNNYECFVTWNFFAVRSSQHLAQPPSWMINPCRLSTTAYSVCSQLPSILRGRNSVARLATRYLLDGPGIESRWRLDFSATVQTGAGAQLAFYTMVTGSFPGVKRPGRGVDHPPLSSAEGKEYSYTSIPLQFHRGLF